MENPNVDVTLPDYFDFSEALMRVDCPYSAAEAHGMCCGVLAVNQTLAPNVFLKTVVDGDARDLYVQEARAALTQLLNVTRTQLNDSDLGLELLLPEDVQLSERLEALQAWCQGFGLGVATAGLVDFNLLPEDSREWLQDVVNIGTSEEFDVSDEDESEDAFAELVEYLRVGVLMMNEELQPLKTAPNIH